MTGRRRWGAGVAAMALAALLAGCSGQRQDPLLQMSAAEALVEGKRLLEKKKYVQAERHFEHAFEVEPNSVNGREGLLLAADALFARGGIQSWVAAEAKYRDFLTRFPTSDRSAYVQFQIGNCLVLRMEKPGRDQTVTREALAAYRQLLRTAPEGSYTAEVEARIEEIEHRLADHEFSVGRFYLRFGLPGAAIHRFKGLLDSYPSYDQKDRVYYLLGVAHRKAKLVEASGDWFRKLREEFPGSPWARRLPKGALGK